MDGRYSHPVQSSSVDNDRDDSLVRRNHYGDLLRQRLDIRFPPKARASIRPNGSLGSRRLPGLSALYPFGAWRFLCFATHGLMGLKTDEERLGDMFTCSAWRAIEPSPPGLIESMKRSAKRRSIWPAGALRDQE